MIVDAVAAEIGNTPRSIHQVTEFALTQLSRVDSDFTRLKVSEGIVPLFINHDFTQGHVESLLTKVNLASDKPKTLDKLAKSVLVRTLADE